MKKRSDMSVDDIDRYIDWVKEFGLEKAQQMQKDIEKSKKKFEKGSKDV